MAINNYFSKPFEIYLSKDAVENFISSMIEESKYCSDVMKKHFNKEILMTIEDNEDNENFKNFTKCYICDNDYVDNDFKVRDHCHITEKYRDPEHRDCNINLKLNHKNPVVFTA